MIYISTLKNNYFFLFVLKRRYILKNYVLIKFLKIDYLAFFYNNMFELLAYIMKASLKVE